MDAWHSIRCCGLLLLLLGVHATLTFAKPRTKAELANRSTRMISPERSTIATSRRRSPHRRKPGSQASAVQTTRSLAEYKQEIARKMTQVRTPEEFLRVFFPVDTLKSRWTNMVNESVQNAWRAGRTGAEDSDRPTFTEETADREMADVNHHGATVRCRDPSPVLIDMYEELNLTRGGVVYVYPECTTVRRCGGSGCCQGGAPCVGRENTRVNISRPFIVIEIVRGRSIHKDARYIKHSLYADTECKCKERPRAPVCRPTVCSDAMRFDEVTCRCVCAKPCPRPYRQNPETCDCHCADKDGGCNKIKRSRRRMPATECTCVMEGRCLMPACKKGYTFSTSSCKCNPNGSEKRRGGDRRPGGRTDDQANLPYPLLPQHRGRTNTNPVFSQSSSEVEPPADFSENTPNYSWSDSDDQAALTRQDHLTVSWDSEIVPSEDQCGSSCPRDVGSGDGEGDE